MPLGFHLGGPPGAGFRANAEPGGASRNSSCRRLRRRSFSKRFRSSAALAKGGTHALIWYPHFERVFLDIFIIVPFKLPVLRRNIWWETKTSFWDGMALCSSLFLDSPKIYVLNLCSMLLSPFFAQGLNTTLTGLWPCW